MKNANKKIKPEVLGLKEYALQPHRASIKINQNENPWDAPDRIKSETLKRIEARQWSRYPDFVAFDLHAKLARFADWTPDGMIAGNGSNELIQALLMVTIGPGKRVLICEPTFALYRQITTVLGGEIISAPVKKDFGFDAHAISDAMRMFNPVVTIICSPNNPTGQVIDAEALSSILRQTSGLVVIDEAYHEFADQSVVPCLRDHENLIVLRTFSKAMALAGLRVGYLLAAPDLTAEIKKAVLPYNLNAFSQAAAEVAIELYETDLKPLVKRIVAERERVFSELQNIAGLTPVRSRANFMIVHSVIKPQVVFEELLRRDILIRDVSSYPMLADYFRLSMGRPDENEKVLAGLREIFESAATASTN
ncbi:MAG TPA: histidinol-phosphate transaminase [Pyrinomonadaceae bacterium]|jgi:histidinol-phosphate aminotransferase|nr:histidinol-phosphate transaminase [Pyrinomonadaceae bacterium]